MNVPDGFRPARKKRGELISADAFLKNQELISAVPVGHLLPEMCQNLIGNFNQNPVTHIVAVSVVVTLKMIDVRHDHPQLLVAVVREILAERRAVLQARHLVVRGALLERFRLLFQGAQLFKVSELRSVPEHRPEADHDSHEPVDGVIDLGSFVRIEQQDENVYVVTYEGLEDYAFVLGKYTVTVDRNTVTDIRWSHDGESTEGGFDADAWGTDQILEMLRMNQEDGVTDAFDVYVREINRRNGHVYQPKVQSDEEIEAEDRQREQEIQEAQRLSSLTPSKMMGIARQAIISLFHLSDAQADHLTVYPPTTEEEEEWAYSMRNGEPCYEVLIGLDSEAGITITEGEVQYTEGTGNYWVFVNTQTGTVEEIYYSLGIGGNG